MFFPCTRESWSKLARFYAYIVAETRTVLYLEVQMILRKVGLIKSRSSWEPLVMLAYLQAFNRAQ